MRVYHLVHGKAQLAGNFPSFQELQRIRGPNDEHPADASIKVHEIFMKTRGTRIKSHFSYKNEALLSIDSLVVFGCFTTLGFINA